MGGDGGQDFEQKRDTQGVRPMQLAGRVVQERERTSGMSADERAWRKRWLQDMEIAKEPKYVPAVREELLNPLRRLYQAPLNFIFDKGVLPYAGEVNTRVFRFYTGRILMGVYIAFAGFYYFKYNTNTWESRSSWRVTQNNPAVYPGEPGYPRVNPERPPHDYYDRGFKDSIFAKQFPQYQNERK